MTMTPSTKQSGPHIVICARPPSRATTWLDELATLTSPRAATPAVELTAARPILEPFLKTLTLALPAPTGLALTVNSLASHCPARVARLSNDSPVRATHETLTYSRRPFR